MRIPFAALIALASPLAAASPPPEQAAAVFADLPRGQPGCAASAMRDGKPIWAQGFGTADLDTGRPIDPDTVFDVGSISKQFTAFAVLQLEAAGKVRLDESIRTYIPELGAETRPVTVRQLLHHSGGMQDYIFLGNLAGFAIAERFTERQALDLVARQGALQFTPGSEYSYSNTGYFLLSVLVERVTGRSMKAYVEAELLKPLGMTATRLIDAYPTGMAARARGYAKDGSGYRLDESLWEPTGDGQINSTVRDMLRWEDNLATGRLGGRALVAKMRETGTLTSGEAQDYAMGLVVDQYRGVPQVQHGGSWAGYNGYALWLPEQRFATVVLCNVHGQQPWRRAHELAAAFLGPVFDNGPVTPPASVSQAAKLAPAEIAPGIYANPAGALIELKRDGDTLSLDYYGRVVALQAGADRVLSADVGGDIVFLAAPAPGQLVYNKESGAFARLTPWTPADLDRFTGSYGLDTVPGTIAIERTPDGLVLKLAADSVPLRPVAEQRFGSDYGVITFAPDGSSFTAAFARNLVFRRR